MYYFLLSAYIAILYFAKQIYIFHFEQRYPTIIINIYVPPITQVWQKDTDDIYIYTHITLGQTTK